MKKSTLKEIKKSMRKLDEAIADHQRVANQRIGIISGGPSIDEENRVFEEAHGDLLRLLRNAGPRTLRAAAECNDLKSVAEEISEIADQNGRILK